MSGELLHEVARALRGPGLELCPCVTCAKARQADRRDAALMLRATRIAGAGITPAERQRWDWHVEESLRWRESVRASAARAVDAARYA